MRARSPRFRSSSPSPRDGRTALRLQWEQVLEQMVARGATGSDPDFDIIFDYLLTEVGRVPINTAPAEEIAQVPHLQAAMADAVVNHRTKNGKLVDFDALASVPGLDVAELRKRRDAIVV